MNKLTKEWTKTQLNTRPILLNKNVYLISIATFNNAIWSNDSSITRFFNESPVKAKISLVYYLKKMFRRKFNVNLPN